MGATEFAYGLAIALLSTIGTLVTVVLKRKPTPIEEQVTNDGTWDKQTAGWQQLTGGWQQRVTYLDTVVREQQDTISEMRDTMTNVLEQLGLSAAYIRRILAYAHDHGATDPPDPPDGLILPD